MRKYARILFVVAISVGFSNGAPAAKAGAPGAAQTSPTSPAAGAPAGKPPARPATQTPPAAAPKLTDEQKATIQSALLRLDNARLRAELAARDVSELLRSLQVPGYDLNMQTLEYQAKPSELRKEK